MKNEVKILIVDDVPYEVDILKAILGDSYLLESAENGSQAIDRIQSFLPDIVLLDGVMPGMDGLEVCKRIRSNPQYKFTKVIMLSSRDKLNDRVKGYEAGADDYITKPFDHEEVAAKVKVFSKLKFVEESDEALRIEKDGQEKLVLQLQDAKEQLLQADKMASIGQLAAGVAHEINNPVGYINSNLGALEEYIGEVFQVLDTYKEAESLLDQDSEVLQRILGLKEKVNLDFLKQDIMDLMKESQEGLARVKQIVQDLKEFSHVDDAEWQLFDLHHGLDSTLNIVNNEIKYKAEVIKEYGDLPAIECQASQLNQVFMNLLVNAAHAIDDNGVITIRTGTKDEWVWVEIEDTGHGISQENQHKLFEPFFTTKPVGQGTGLGLSLSYGIVQAHGGRIDVESTVGKGTRFRVWLPVRQAEERAKEAG